MAALHIRELVPKTFTSLFLIITYITTTYSVCTWPADFVNTTWIDSLKGDLVFGDTQMQGWSFNIQIQGDASLQALDEWECVTYDDSGPYLIMKTIRTFLQFVVINYYGYRCLKLEKITDASYRYYQMDPIQISVDYERLSLSADSSLSDPSFLCENAQVTPASGSEFQVMIRKGFEGVAMVTCPYNLLVDYTFTYVNTSDSTMSCDPNSDVGNIDLCTNVTMVTLQSPACSSYPLYSDADTTMCVDVVVVGADTFISLYNNQYDTSNTDPNIHQFACVGINANGSSMSVTSEHCKANQSPTEVPVTSSDQAEGAVWSLTPTGDPCPPCPDLTAPAKGSVTIATNGAVTSATYTCESNYTLSSNETRTCQTNGTWSGTQPSCTCPLPSSPPDGGVTLSTDGLIATFTCNYGYILDGSAENTCDTVTNLWSDTEPVCNECEQLVAPSSGSMEILFTGLTSVVYYECDVGTSLIGDVTRTCQQDTTWSLSAPICNSCPTLTPIVNGNVTLMTSGTITTAEYTCSDGYDLVGDNTSVCTTSGAWDTSPPSCECIPPDELVNGSMTVSTGNTEVTYTCDVGFTLDGPGVRYCQSDGTGWSSVDPLCSLCEVFTVPSNGTATPTTNGTVTMVTYTCNVGFTMNGESTSTCTSDGLWTTSTPNCSECNALQNVASGTFNFYTDGTATYADYTCDVGTTISGDVTVSCDVNGEWSLSSANTSCVKCPDLADVSGGKFSLNTNGTTSVAAISCDSGYTVQGETAIECQSDGTWSSTAPDCVKTGSGTEGESSTTSLLPAVIAMAIVIALLIGALVVTINYKLKKRTTIKCPDLADVSGGKFSLNTNGTTSVAAISCDSGYTVQGETAIECQSDGTWSSTAPDCAGNNSSKRETTANGVLPNVQRPPLYHGTSIIDPWNKFSNSPAPISHNTTPRPDTSMSNTSSLMKSVLSAGSLNLDLVRETTTSSMFNDQPAPWPNKSLKDRDKSIGNSVNSHIGSFPPINEHNTGALVMNKHSNGGMSPRKKKIPFSKKIQRQNSVNDTTDGHKANATRGIDKPPDKTNGRRNYVGDIADTQNANATKATNKPANGRTPLSGGDVPKHKSILASRSSDVGAIKPKPALRDRTSPTPVKPVLRERASTPVKHSMKVKDSEVNETPTTNTFTTVQ